MKRRRRLDQAIAVFGFLSFASLIMYFLALHDSWWDYASPALWARAGQNLPYWYDPGNRCPGEWGALQVGFLFLLAFHILLFIRLMLKMKRSEGTPA